MELADSLKNLADQMLWLIPLVLVFSGFSQLFKSTRSHWALGLRLRWLAADLKLPARHDITLPDGHGEMVAVDHIFALPDRLVVVSMANIDGRVTQHNPDDPVWEVADGRTRKSVANPLRPMERAMLAVNFASEGNVDRNGRVVTLKPLSFDGPAPEGVAAYPYFKAEMKSLAQTVSQDDQIAIAWDKLAEAAGPPAEKKKGPPMGFWLGWTFLAVGGFIALAMLAESFVTNLPNQ